MKISQYFLTVCFFFAFAAVVSAQLNREAFQASVTITENGHSLDAVLYYQYDQNLALKYVDPSGVSELETYPVNLPTGQKWEGCDASCAGYPFALDMAKMHADSAQDCVGSQTSPSCTIIQVDDSWEIDVVFDGATFTPSEIYWKGGPQNYDRSMTVNSIEFGEGAAGEATLSAWASTDPFALPASCEGENLQCYSVVDLALVLDESGSIDPEDWEKTKDFAKQVVNVFPEVSDSAVKITVVTFANTASVRIPMSGNRTAILEDLDNLVQTNGETFIAEGIETAQNELFSERGRADIPDLMIVLTDGNANLPGLNIQPPLSGQEVFAVSLNATDIASTNARNANISMYAVAVGKNEDIAIETLETIVGGEEGRSLELADFDELLAEINTIVASVCEGDTAVPQCSCASGALCACGGCLCLDDCSASAGTPTSCYEPFCDALGVCQPGELDGCCFLETGDCNGRGDSSNYGLVVDEAECACTCDLPWTGTVCDNCPLDDTCNDAGSYDGDACTCTCNLNFWTGDDCSECPAELGCENNGQRNAGSCSCDCDSNQNWSGDLCNECSSLNCGDGGIPDEQACVCDCTDPDYTVSTDGKTCECTIDCGPNGSKKDGECACECDAFWESSTGYCDVCNLSDEICAPGAANLISCSCDSCPDNYALDEISGLCECQLACANGEPNGDCTACDCSGTNWVGELCNQCPTDLCNDRVSPNQDDCSCDCSSVNWGGDFCETCPLTCENGSVLSDATTCECECDDNYVPNAEKNACECGFTCENGGQPNETCNGCVCPDPVNSWSGPTCNVCEPACVNGTATVDGNTCGCVCDPDYFGGDLCDVCQRDCSPGGVKVDGDCSCDCTDPDYSVGDDGYCECTIDCLNGGTADDSDCSCTCDSNANWSGKYCHQCALDCGEGVLNTTTCECSDCPTYYELSDDLASCDCVIPCENGTPNGDCQCDCTESTFWEGTLCDTCPETLNCNYGTVSDCQCDCTDSNWSGALCNECELECGPGGSPSTVEGVCECVCKTDYVLSDNKDACVCNIECLNGGEATDECGCLCDDSALWSGTYCGDCDINCINGIEDPDEGICKCLCDESALWTGTFCDECPAQLNDEYCQNGANGFGSSAVFDRDNCTCVCEGDIGGAQCDECHLSNEDCAPGFLSERSCSCICFPFSGAYCDECTVECPEGKGELVPETCSCACLDLWEGERCKLCDPSVDRYRAECVGRVYDPITCTCSKCETNEDCYDVLPDDSDDLCTDNICLPDGTCGNPDKDCSAILEEEPYNEWPACWDVSCPDPTTGECVATPKEQGYSCDDGNDCTWKDRCDGQGTCVGFAIPTFQTEPCYYGEAFEASTNPCDDFRCVAVEGEGTCQYVGPIECEFARYGWVPAADGDECRCVPPECETNDDCDQSDPCNPFVCKMPQGVCEPNPVVCDNTNPCLPEECIEGSCEVVNPILCDDGDACTLDICIEGECENQVMSVCAGCFFEYNCTACSAMPECEWIGCSSEPAAEDIPSTWLGLVQFLNATDIGWDSDSLWELANQTDSTRWTCAPATWASNKANKKSLRDTALEPVGLDLCQPEPCTEPPEDDDGLTPGQIGAITTVSIVVPLAVVGGVVAAAIIFRMRKAPVTLAQDVIELGDEPMSMLKENPLHQEALANVNRLEGVGEVGPPADF